MRFWSIWKTFIYILYIYILYIYIYYIYICHYMPCSSIIYLQLLQCRDSWPRVPKISDLCETWGYDSPTIAWTARIFTFRKGKKTSKPRARRSSSSFLKFSPSFFPFHPARLVGSLVLHSSTVQRPIHALCQKITTSPSNH